MKNSLSNSQSVTEVHFIGISSDLCSIGSKTMLSLPSVPQCGPETFIYSDEVPALAHLFVLIVSVFHSSSMPSWPLVTAIAHSFIPNLQALMLHPAWLTSHRVCFRIEVMRVRSLPWIMSKRQSIPLIRCLQKSYMLKQVTLSSATPALWVFLWVGQPWVGTCYGFSVLTWAYSCEHWRVEIQV